MHLAGSSTLSAYATLNYSSGLCPAAEDSLTILTLLFFLSPLSSPCLFPLQAKSCICHMCGAHLNRLHSCLYCVFFGCFTKKHIHEHAKNKRHNLGKPRNSPASALHTSKASVPSHYSGPLQHQLLSVRDYSITLSHFLHCFLSSTLPFWWERLIQSNVMVLC